MEQKAAFDEANPQLARLRGRNYPHKRMPSMYAVSRSMFRRFSAAHMTPEEIANFRGVLLRHLPLIESMFSVNINVYRRQREPVYQRGRSAGPRGAHGGPAGGPRGAGLLLLLFIDPPTTARLNSACIFVDRIIPVYTSSNAAVRTLNLDVTADGRHVRMIQQLASYLSSIRCEQCDSMHQVCEPARHL